MNTAIVAAFVLIIAISIIRFMVIPLIVIYPATSAVVAVVVIGYLITRKAREV